MLSPPPTVLVVDDEELILDLLKRSLRGLGHKVQTARSAEQGLKLFRQDQASIATVVTDICMPGVDGLALLGSLKSHDPDLPVILMTAYADIDTARAAIRAGAYDYVTKPFDLSSLGISVGRALEKRRLVAQNRAYRENLERRVEERTQQLREAFARLNSIHLEAICVLCKVAEANDTDTGQHIRRVSLYCTELARALGQPEEFVRQIEYSAPMHDIGKLSIPDLILKKNGQLTPAEWEVMRQHTTRGAEILAGVPFLEMAREIALCHHERFDGNGYPRGLQGQQIPLSARIVSLCDVFDALLSRRCYKAAMPVATALELIEKQVGSHFDPELFEAFQQLLPRMLEIWEQHKGPLTAPA